MVVDRRFLRRLLAEIEDQVTFLETCRPEGPGLLEDRLKRNGVYYTLQSAIEAVVSVAHHLIAQANLPTPERNVDALTVLRDHGVIRDVELAQRLPAMIRFRNLLVHRYWDVAQDKVWAIMGESLGDLRLFCREVENFLERHPDL